MRDRVQRIARRLAALEIWLVAPALAAGIASTRLLLPALGIAGGFWIVRWAAYGRPSVRTPADWPLALLVLTLPVTVWATAQPEITHPQVYRLLAGILLLYSIANWATTTLRLRLLVAGTLFAGFGLALVAPLIVRWKTDRLLFLPDVLYARLPDMAADVANPNSLAGVLTLLLPITVALLLFGWSALTLRERLALSLATLGMSVTLLLSLSRGGIGAFVVALVVLLVLRWTYAWLLLPLAGIVGGAVVSTIGPTALVEFVTSNPAVGGLDRRLEIWSRALYMIQDFPFTGIGMGSFGPVADLLYPFFLVAPDTVPHAHNIFLQVAVDLGLPGLIAWLAVLLLILTVSWQLYCQGRADDDRLATGLGAGLLGSQIALVVHGLTDAAVWGMIRAAIVVWLVWGITIAAWRIATRARNHT